LGVWLLEEFGEFEFLHPRFLQRTGSIEMSELLSAIGEGRESSLKNPSGEPAFCGGKALESLDGFESAIQLFVAAFNDVCSFRTAVVEEMFRFHISREEIAVVEDVVEGRDLQGIIVMPWSSPTNVTLQIFLSKVRKFEDFFVEIFYETPVGFVASHL